MAGQREPTSLVKAKGKKHLTKAEIAARENAEIKAPATKVTPPKYLNKEQKKKFRKYASELLALKLISNLDINALARFVIAESQYLDLTEAISKMEITKEITVIRKNKETDEDEEHIETVLNKDLQDLMVMQDRAFKQCRQGASDFGLTISSRCKLVVPKPPEKKNNKFEKFIKQKDTT